jgi:hypothetical protein
VLLVVLDYHVVGRMLFDVAHGGNIVGVGLVILPGV